MRSILIAKLNSAQLLENSAHNITKNYVCTVCHNYNWCILDSTQGLNSMLGVQIQLHLAADQNWALTSFHISFTKIIKGAYKNMEKVCTPKIGVKYKKCQL